MLKGRVRNFPISFKPVHEVSLLPASRLATLIVQYHHSQMRKDVDTVMAAVRKEVWVVQGRKTVKKVDWPCTICRRKRGKPVEQVMGWWPEFRTQMNPAFSTVCINHFGPW